MRVLTVNSKTVQDTKGWKYPFEIIVKVQWPATLKHEDRTYRNTGKEGIQNGTGLPCAEYEDNHCHRVWLIVTGEVTPE